MTESMHGAITLTTLVENTVSRRGLLAEHGLAFWIEVGPHRVLFDTGQGMVLHHNARKLGILLSDADAIILSHGHYDHVGGLRQATQESPAAPIHFHPASRAPKFRQTPEGNRRVSHPFWEESGSRVTNPLQPSTGPVTLFDRVTITGEIPRVTEFEDEEESFTLDPDGQHVDPLVDDQALFFDTRQGLVIVLGCAHAGVVNTLHYIADLTGGRPILAVLGGMHLLHASDARLQRTIEAFRAFNVRRIAGCHCTGLRATVALWSALPGKCFACPVGARFSFST